MQCTYAQWIISVDLWWKREGKNGWATEWERRLDWSVKINVANIGDANQLIKKYILIDGHSLLLFLSSSACFFLSLFVYIDFISCCKQTVRFSKEMESYAMKHLWISLNLNKYETLTENRNERNENGKKCLKKVSCNFPNVLIHQI